VNKEAEVLEFWLIRKRLVFWGRCEILIEMSSGPFANTKEVFRTFYNRNKEA